MTGEIILYDYPRSSACYRVRIALNLKKIKHESIQIDLQKGEHKRPEYQKIHPQAIVPAIEINGEIITQSLAIIEYLDEFEPRLPLLPQNAAGKARARALSYAIAMEIHPICNLSVVNHVVQLSGGDEQTKIDWMKKYIYAGLSAFESYLGEGQISRYGRKYSPIYCLGELPGMADCCLIPQLFNARRWGVNYSEFSKICKIEQACSQLDAFRDAHPDNWEAG